MNEYDIIKSIGTIIGNELIGDDCAYLRDLGIVISQDSLIENIHFKREWSTPFQLGYKSVAVNISDILASGAEPKYITIALSLTKDVDSTFINEFYEGAKSALHGVKIAGGDITGSKNDIIISVTAIGSTKNRNISSRKNAKPGYKIITRGEYGTSAAGLNELISGGSNSAYINAHLMPVLDYDFSKMISKSISGCYAMMDTSDGLADALFKIAESSNVKIIADYNLIPHLSDISEEQVLFGGEDYNLVAAIPEEALNLLDNVSVIGNVYPFDGVRLDISGKTFSEYSELNLFNHFK